jgi:DNA polymerase-3 subunit alpha
MMTEEEMINYLTLDGAGISEEDAKQAILNTQQVGDPIEEFDFRHGTIVPRVKVPEFTLNKCLYHKGYPITDKFYDSKDEQDLYLMYQIEQGLINKHIELDKVKQDRIEYELDILDYISTKLNQPLSAYLNLTVNIVDLAWQVSLVGVGRGSACGFFVNYLIGITQANPLEYDLPAWRFLNKERAELPKLQHWAV